MPSFDSSKVGLTVSILYTVCQCGNNRAKPSRLSISSDDGFVLYQVKRGLSQTFPFGNTALRRKITVLKMTNGFQLLLVFPDNESLGTRDAGTSTGAAVAANRQTGSNLSTLGTRHLETDTLRSNIYRDQHWQVN